MICTVVVVVVVVVVVAAVCMILKLKFFLTHSIVVMHEIFLKAVVIVDVDVAVAE
jgi:hypothetical protein